MVCVNIEESWQLQVVPPDLVINATAGSAEGM